MYFENLYLNEEERNNLRAIYTMFSNFYKDTTITRLEFNNYQSLIIINAIHRDVQTGANEFLGSLSASTTCTKLGKALLNIMDRHADFMNEENILTLDYSFNQYLSNNYLEEDF